MKAEAKALREDDPDRVDLRSKVCVGPTSEEQSAHQATICKTVEKRGNSTQQGALIRRFDRVATVYEN